MKLLQATIAFFTDDLLVAAIIIAWIAIAAVGIRTAHPGPAGAVVYLMGMIAILAFGAWRKSKAR
jgi:ABC-type proline/glycine betaine transport system permease subunit